MRLLVPAARHSARRRDDTLAVVDELKKLRNTRYNDRPVSGCVMAEHVSELAMLLPARDDVERLEGRIWLPDALQGRASWPQRENWSARQGNGDMVSRAAPDVDRVPTISAFYGISIYMYADDHLPPHFHAAYGGHEAMVEIETGRIAQGSLPRTAEKLVAQWAEAHRVALLENWVLCATMKPPKRIPPLK